MTDPHPNLAVLARLNPADMAGSADAFAPDVVFHYFNPHLPDLTGDYIGREGVVAFFAKIGAKSKGTFTVTPQSIHPFGDELVVTHTINTMTLNDDLDISTQVVVVWRIVDGLIREVWDIPSVFT
ncbi:MAG: nuclear transport factor 2 family protein [Acidimicrobiales bacterium]|nr:nuclear transport factor 2 family protein [Hyphomonadaceae bacterium]RZV42156.1 MAG: nuclear transport factor 2 family protein [Acidimicrobiales bacterium]